MWTKHQVIIHSEAQEHALLLPMMAGIEANFKAVGKRAQKNWRRQRGFSYLAKAITGTRFKDGIEVNTVDQDVA